MEILEIDFKLIEDKEDFKIFLYSQEDGTIYDFTDSTVRCLFYKDPTPPVDIVCTIDIPTGKITIPFTSSHTDTLGSYEYIIEQTPVGGDPFPITRGNITIHKYIPFSETIEAYLRSELPANITLNEDYRNQRIFYWRRILQEAFKISDVNLNVESGWPVLVNALFAKLVVYDALMLAMKGSLMGFFGGDYTSSQDLGGAVRSIETGPTKVEFHSVSQGLEQLFKVGASGKTPFEILISDICSLGGFLKVKLPMCQSADLRMAPRVSRNPKWKFPTLKDIGYHGTQF